MKKVYSLIVASLLLCSFCSGQISITNLLTQSQTTPLGIDDKTPSFSWRMEVEGNTRGYSQRAYQIIVTDPKGMVMWDTKKVISGMSLNIPYAGTALQPTTKYSWRVTVWDQNEKSANQSSYFETGLMKSDAKLSGWDGATWIGGSSDELGLYSHYLSVFRIRYTQTISTGSTKAGFVFGANDARLMDRNKNTYGLQHKKDQSYIKVELDVSAVNGTESGKAKLNIYRVGYTNKDQATVPFESHEILTSVINQSNKNAPHTITFTNSFGMLVITIDEVANFTGKLDPPVQRPWGIEEQKGLTVNVNPAGKGWDYTTYGLLCDIGFALDPNQKASFSNVEVSHVRPPSTILFKEDLANEYNGIYKGVAGLAVKNELFELTGGTHGLLIVRDPSHYSSPMVRTKFSTQNKEITAARLYVTARGIYEMYINGKRVGNDYFNPGLTQYNITHLYQTVQQIQ